MPIRILLAEDDKNMRYMLQDSLQMAGYEVDSFADGLAALTGFLKGTFQLCVLDVMLPGKDGFALAQDIRRRDLEIPIVFLTARIQKEDRIAGFKLGADDYITKPFSVEELLLRIESILKRVYRVNTTADTQFIHRLGKLTCDFGNQQIAFNDTVIQLTNKESKLLKLFCLHRNKIIDRDEIQKAIWEDEGYFVGRSMDVFISRLRKLLRDDPAVSIVNIHGVGYKLEVTDQPTEK
ncbi:response regulator transcription factor [Pseudochryseolinea flava]|uniref:DNA-binding response regulator n=1 Tax=Pseudochryseolinea flava TaxID=2059302 RepID=A0A364XZ14_9BACT|nr:response regulator transcription factor [Pseudochryseolinea flava]RAV99723.1 DNA-binding response regulator [Pseudochryseolinea flava]